MGRGGVGLDVTAHSHLNTNKDTVVGWGGVVRDVSAHSLLNKNKITTVFGVGWGGGDGMLPPIAT